jgi:predicted dehydrogenase
MIRVGIIGAGAICRAHIEAYKKFGDRCRIVGIADIYPEKAERRAQEFELEATVFSDYKELLAQGVDLVSICTPPYTHAPIAVDSMQAGANALVEKPMAASLEECDLMLAASEETGKLLSIIAQNRYTNPLMKLKQMLDSGLAGTVVHAQVDSHWWRGHCYYDLWWRGTWEKEGGGCTINHAVHHIDALQWMVGMPSVVQALMANTSHDNAEIEDLSVAVLRFPDGKLGQVTSSVVHHGQEQQLIFQGQHARISAPWKVVASTSTGNGFPQGNPELEKQINDAYEQLPTLAYEGHAGQIDNVLSTLEGKETLLIDGASGRNTLELITAIYKASSTGLSVSLPLTKEDSFYTREGIMKRATHFYEKKTAVENFMDDKITTGSDYKEAKR